MGRQARIVVPGEAHHVTQRGNRFKDVFLDDADRRKYLLLVRKYCLEHGLDVWAYCLMSDHVHPVAVPHDARALGVALRDAHTAYASYVNWRQHLVGHLWQGRFFSCPLDKLHLWAAVRYVERNPVRVGLVERAEDYPCSSAAAHCGLRKDDMLGVLPRPDWLTDWSGWLRDEDREACEIPRKRTHTGRPCGSAEFIARLEALLAGTLRHHNHVPITTKAIHGYRPLAPPPSLARLHPGPRLKDNRGGHA